MPGNTTLGLYLTASQSKLTNQLDQIVLDDYFKVFVIDATASIDFPPSRVESVAKEMNAKMMRRGWNTMKGNIEKIVQGVEMGQPVIIETHHPNNQTTTNVSMYMVIDEHGDQHFGLITQSLCSIKNRMVSVVHYLNYAGASSVEMAMSKSDYFTRRLIDSNL